jgi:hypothetical protein
MINRSSRLAEAFWEHGRSADCPILDFHAHMGGFAGSYMPSGEPEAMIRTMETCNTALTCFMGMDAITNPPVGVLKDMEVARKYPDHFKVYHVVPSPHLDAKRDLAHLESEPELFVGLKFHSQYYRVKLSHPAQTPYWEYADRTRSLVICHTWGSSEYNDVAEATKILDKYHDLVFIAGHSFFEDWKGAVELARRYPNVLLELTAVTDRQGALELLVEGAGSDRILFGTDLPWFATHNGVGAVLSARITDDDRRNILYRNGKRILARFPWFQDLWKRKTGGVD